MLILEGFFALGISLITLGLAIILSMWIANYFASASIYEREGYLVRKVC